MRNCFLRVLQSTALLLFVSTSIQASDFASGPWGFDTDGGDQPEIPGCTKTSNQNNCSGATVGLVDRCSLTVDDELSEIVGPASCPKNPSPTTRTLNCNTYCMIKYGLPGECRTAAIVAACANDTNVGYCLCGDR